MASVEGYRRVGLAELYTNLMWTLTPLHGMDELVVRFAEARPYTELSDSEVASTAKKLLAELDEKLTPFTRDKELYSVLSKRDKLELFSKLWDNQRGVKTKLEQLHKVLAILYGALEPVGYASGKAIICYKSDEEQATALTDYALDLLKSALDHNATIDAAACANLCSQFLEIAGLADRILKSSKGLRLVIELRRLVDELEVVSLLEAPEGEIA